MSRLIDLTGQKFGRLTVIKQVEKNKHGGTQWLCKCECGNYSIVSTCHLRDGHSKSCGCLNKQQARERFMKHGLADTRLYNIFCDIKRRCYKKNRKAYKNYGARGIEICSEWLSDFQVFYNWAIANGYKEGLTIDRINVDKGYTSENCRWVDMKTQQRNRRDNHLVVYKGETHCIAEWAEILNIKDTKLYNRINKLHWSIEKAFTTK